MRMRISWIEVEDVGSLTTLITKTFAFKALFYKMYSQLFQSNTNVSSKNKQQAPFPTSTEDEHLLRAGTANSAAVRQPLDFLDGMASFQP